MKISRSEECERLIEILSRIRCRPMPEETVLHTAVADALTEAEIAFTHEARLAPGMRADFLVGTVAIEIKKGRPQRAALLRQITAYLTQDAVSEIIVLTQRCVPLPAAIGGKRVTQLSLERLWGISLP